MGGDPSETTAPQPGSWDDGSVLRDREPVLSPGSRVGRFVVGGVLGVGGMGVVYEASDPELGRRVALKLVRSPLLGTADHDRARARLMREAQAMARISHLNVVTVFDVGELGERVFIAMELLEGGTLRDWCAEPGGRGWRAVRDAFVAAGRGLAAAHAAGVVHRDFKPQNVLVTRAGRIAVTDFGLAEDAQAAGPPAPDPSRDAGDTGGERLTLSRSPLGTPAYMAPEQIAGDASDARTDQFSFCVALYEALHGVNPFGADPLPRRHQRMLAADIAAPARRAGAPSRLTDALLRGLRADPDARFPSMDALLAELSFDPAARRRRLAVGGLVALSLAALGATYAGRAGDPACAIDDGSLAGAWDDAARAAVAAGLRRSGVHQPDELARRVTAALDDHTVAWKEMARSSCVATRIKGEQSGAVFELREACLARRLDEVRALGSLLATASAEVAAGAVEASLSLTPIRACGEIQALLAPVEVPADPATRARVRELQRALAMARALERAGQYARALEATGRILPEAAAAGHVPLEAEVRDLAGDLQARTGARTEAVATLRAAGALAEASGHDELLAQVRTRLAHIEGYMLSRRAEGELWADLAGATIRRLGSRPDLTGYLELSRGAIAFRAADYEAAATRWRRAEELLTAALGADHVDLARVLNNLAQAAGKLDRPEDAARYLQRTLELRERLLGADHPLVAGTLANLGGHHRRQGAHAEARAAYERAVRIAEAHQPDHPQTAGYLMSLAMIDMDEERFEESLALLRRALAIYERPRAQREGDLDYAHVLGTMGNVLREQGKPAPARAAYQRAVAALEASGDTGHERAGAIYVGMGLTLSELGDQDAAIGWLRRSMPPWEALSPTHLNLGYPLTGIGLALVRAGRPLEAVPPLERALAIRRSRGRPQDLAETQHALALALARRDRARAAQLARDALETLAPLGERGARRRDEIQRWLDRHAGAAAKGVQRR